MAAEQRSPLTGAQIRAVMGERRLRRELRDGEIVRLWRGAYVLPSRRGENPGPGASRLVAAPEPIPLLSRLSAATPSLGRPVTACLDTAAELDGFSTQSDQRTHVLGDAVRARRTPGASPPSVRPVRHGSFGVVDPAETAVQLAAGAANPPRALAVLDAALRCQSTTRDAMAAGLRASCS